MARKGTYELYNRLLDGELEILLIAWKAENVTFDEQATRLRDRDINVSRETVRRWSAALVEATT